MEFFNERSLNLRKALRFVLTLHVTCLVFLSMARVVTLIVIRNMLGEEARGITVLIESVLRGAWLDNSTLCYVDILPLFCILVAFHTGWLRKWVLRCLAVYYIVLHNLVIFLAFSNIPYMAEFGKVLGSTWFVWLQGDRTVVSMVGNDPSILGYILIGLSLWAAYGVWCVHAANSCGRAMVCAESQDTQSMRSFSLSMLIVLMFVLAIRGTVLPSPIGSAQAFFSGDMVLSQATLSQAQSMVRTFDHDLKMIQGKDVTWLDGSALEACSQEFFGKGASERPFLTQVVPNDSAPLAVSTPPNIVLVLMESMSIHYTHSYDSEMNVTPCLDSLAARSIYFSNCYSTGFRTNNGITGSLYSMPAYLERHCIHHRSDRIFQGLPYELHKMGYRNMFFCTHGPKFDNLGEFALNHGFDDFFSSADYPQSEQVTCWGVSDKYLYGFALDKMRQAGQNGNKPFFSVLLTITHHPPYYVPDDFQCHSQTKDLKTVELADYYLKAFMDSVSREPWFENTVFVFVGDHGKRFKPCKHEVNDQVNHVPLLFFSPRLQAVENKTLVSQADIPAILLGLMGHGYEYESLAYDVLSHEREYVLYSTMTHVVCRSKNRIFAYHVAEGRKKYYILDDDGRIMKETITDARFERMERYCLSAFQLSDMIRNNAGSK